MGKFPHFSRKKRERIPISDDSSLFIPFTHSISNCHISSKTIGQGDVLEELSKFLLRSKHRDLSEHYSMDLSV